MGQVLCLLLMFEKGLNPSLESPKRTLRISDAKSGYKESKCFQARESAGCLMNPSLEQPVECHLICSAVCFDIYHLFNLGISGK